MLAAANRLSIAGAEQALDFLMEDYLIFEATPGTESAIHFARRHRMIAQMLGLGNASEGLALFSVGTDRPALGVDVGRGLRAP